MCHKLLLLYDKVCTRLSAVTAEITCTVNTLSTPGSDLLKNEQIICGPKHRAAAVMFCQVLVALCNSWSMMG